MNGVLVNIPVEALIEGTPDSLDMLARLVRSRLQDIHQKLHVDVPVYLVLSKADHLLGFDEFFEQLSREESDQVLGTTLRKDQNGTDATVLRAEFEAHYAAQNPSQARLYEGVPQWLDWARQQGVALGICTNKLERLARDGMQQLDIAEGFGAITGSDTYGVGKPSPEPLLRTLAQLGVAPQETLFFGDTHADAACAQAAGVRFAWHSVGYGDARVQALPQLLRYASYGDLLRQLGAEQTEQAALSV